MKGYIKIILGLAGTYAVISLLVMAGCSLQVPTSSRSASTSNGNSGSGNSGGAVAPTATPVVVQTPSGTGLLVQPSPTPRPNYVVINNLANSATIVSYTINGTTYFAPLSAGYSSPCIAVPISTSISYSVVVVSGLNYCASGTNTYSGTFSLANTGDCLTASTVDNGGGCLGMFLQLGNSGNQSSPCP